MSQQPPSTYPQQPAPPYAAGPPKYRPGIRWFVIGGLLLVASAVIFVGALVLALKPLFHEDAVFAAASSTTVDLPAHSQRALYSDTETLSCTATDGSGADLALRPVSGHFTFNQWTAVSGFDTGDGHVSLDCSASGAGTHVRVGTVPTTGSLVPILLLGIFAPLLLGLTGLVVLIVTLVLFLSRPPRPQNA